MLYLWSHGARAKGRFGQRELIGAAFCFNNEFGGSKKTFCLMPSGYNFSEKALLDMLKAAGGKWVPKEKSWFVLCGAIRGTEREERITEGLIKKNRRE